MEETNTLIIKERNIKSKKFFQEKAIFIVLIILFIIMGIAKTDTFLTFRNITNILRQVTVLGIFACGMTVVLIGGNFDLSVGSTYSLAIVLPLLLQPFGIWLSIIVTLIAGLIIGVVNGYFVGRLKANGLIVTLGMLSIVQGIAFIVSRGRNVQGDPTSTFGIIGGGYLFRIPVPVYIFLIIAVLTHVLLSKTKFGRALYATGGNELAASFAGIDTGKIQMQAFILLGLFCAVGGIITSSLLANGQPNGGKGFEFDVITAAVLGGTSLFGGKGNIANTVVGVLLLGLIANSMILLGFHYNFQLVVKGIILISAVFYDGISNRERV